MAYTFDFGNTAASLLDRALERQATETRFSREMNQRRDEFAQTAEARRNELELSTAQRDREFSTTASFNRQQLRQSRDIAGTQLYQQNRQFKENQETDAAKTFASQYGLRSTLSPEMQKLAGPGSLGSELWSKGGFKGDLSRARVQGDQPYVDMRMLGIALQQRQHSSAEEARKEARMMTFINEETGELTSVDRLNMKRLPGYTPAQERSILEREAPPRIELDFWGKAAEAVSTSNKYNRSIGGVLAPVLSGILRSQSNIPASNARMAERGAFFDKNKGRVSQPLFEPNFIRRIQSSDTAPADFLLSTVGGGY